MKINNRNVALDLVRVIACLLVMVQHSNEFYYIGDQGALVLDSSVYSIGWLLYNIYHPCATESLRLSLSSVLCAKAIFL